MQQRSRVGKLIVIALSCAVAFGTTMALVLPGITLEKPACELVEHTHTEACYTQTAPAATRTLSCAAQAHVHTEACYNASGALVCGMADYLIHTHNSDCYDAAGALVCPLEEHTGTPHVHGETCYTTQQTLVCELEESDEHTHTASCYDQTRTLTCTEPAVSEHVHDAGCFVTEQAEAELTCQLEENEEHQHGPLCYGTWELTCGLEEHTHTEECNLPAELSEEEQAQVDEVIAMIDALPTQEEVGETLAAYEDIGDEDGYDAYLAGVVAQAKAAYEAYCALTEAQQAKVTNAARLMALEPLWSAQTLDGNRPLTGDSAYVTKIEVTGITDGTGPFDDNDAAGNDSNAQNQIVRTFDTVTYRFEVHMESYDSTAYNEAWVKMEFVLPLTEDQATFDQGAMAWIDQPEPHAPVLTTEIRTINDVQTQCQVLTCYKHLLPSANHPSVVPGEFGENVTVNVKSMKNGDTFAPIFSACMEHGTWSDEKCPTEGHGVEKQTIVANPITVSAAPKYNIQIVGRSAYKSTFDFNSGNTTAQAYGDGYNKGQVTGRVLCLGVTLQLYNDNASRKFKGIEIPDGSPITFDLELSSSYHINDPAPPTGYSQGQNVDVTDTYMPLLWSCDGNQGGTSNYDGRILEDGWGGALNAAPYNTGTGPGNCAQGGGWTAVQTGTTIHVTVSGYAINTDAMPIRDANSSGAVKYGKDLGIGCFSAGEIWIVQPYNKIGSTSANTGPQFDVVSDYGQGTFVTGIQGMNLSAKSISGQEVKDNNGTNSSQMKRDDDTYSPSVSLLLPGSIINRAWYTDWNNTNVAWRDINGISPSWGGCFSNGQDVIVTGSKARLVGGFTYDSKNQEENLMCWGTNLLKFNAEAFEIDTSAAPTFTNTSLADGQDPQATMTVLYATKKDGTDWVSDYELQHTYEDNLQFYSSVSDIPQGYKCVGVLFCFKGGIVSGGTLKYIGSVPVKITDNTDLAGNTYMLVSTSRAWTQYMLDDAGMTLADIPDWTDPNTKLENFPSGYYTSGNIAGSVWYQKEEYRSDGSGVMGKHNCEWGEWGDTLLLINYKTGITKNLAQKSDGTTDKTTYSMDAEQRVVDFKLQPRTCYDQAGSTYSLGTTVTIVDTLPKHLTYRAGSSFFGGTYTQTSVNGGTQGKITDGTLREPDTVVSNADGTQTLTWIIPNVTVGEPMEPIYYSADIGDRNHPSNDVPTDTTNLVNKVRITATHDLREPTKANGNYAEVGISVTRGSASSYGKYSEQKVVESDGKIGYVIYYDNNSASEATTPVLVDAMPVAGTLNSSFSGSWTIASFKVLLNGTESTLANLNASLHYTLDEAYAGQTLQDLQNNQSNPVGHWEADAEIAGDGTVSDLIGKMPVMWVLNCTSLPAHSELRVEYTIELIPEAGQTLENIKYVNQFSTGTTTTTTETPAVRRTLEGLTWLDDNTNGIQDEAAERRISGVKVTLLKLNETTGEYEAYHYQGNSSKPVVSVETGKQISVRAEDSTAATDYAADSDESLGRYKFTDLPAGTFAVRFEDGEKTRIADLIASPVRRGTDDTRDSDGVPTYSSDHATLQQTMIEGIKMPAAEDMSQVLFESKYHDSGFYEKGPELPMTGGMGTGVFCALGAGLLALGLTGALARRKKHGARRR